jgi:hypothetical protein
VLSGVFFYRRLVRHEATSPRAMDTVLSFALEGFAPRDSAPRPSSRQRRTMRAAASRGRGTTRVAPARPKASAQAPGGAR